MKTRFKGHETFFFREGWLSKAMIEMQKTENKDLFSGKKGIVKLGVGSNMVKAIKYWMITSNLAEYDTKTKSYKLTELGKIIANHDPYLEDIFSLWIIHVNIARNYENATTWNLFFNDFEAKEFTITDVKNVLKHYIEVKEIKCSDKSLDADINVLLNMYSKEKNDTDPEENYSCPLERLGLIKIKRDMYTREIPSVDSLDKLVVLYVILLLLESSNSNRISISDLESAVNSPGKLLNLNRVYINEYLEKLENFKFIKQEKTAGLDNISLITDKTPNEIVKMYFEEEGKQ